MTLLDENKTEAYLLRVLIEAGRRVNNYPERRVCIILAFEMHSEKKTLLNPFVSDLKHFCLIENEGEPNKKPTSKIEPKVKCVFAFQLKIERTPFW